MVSEMQIGMISKLNMAAAKTNEWFLNSGATIHACNDKAQFKTYYDLKEPEEILMVNSNVAKVVGKGSVELIFTSRQKLTLLNVFHVLEIRKTLVSASLLCKRGIKVVQESYKVIMSKVGNFIGKGYACNGMFKLSINEINCISAYMLEHSSSLWHSRLGHINYKSLKYMVRHSIYSLHNCENTDVSFVFLLSKL